MAEDGRGAARPDPATWLRRRPRWVVLCIAALAGVLAATGQAPLGWVLPALAGFAGGAVLLVAAQGWRRAALIGQVFGTAYFLLALSWLIEPFMVDIARHGWMAPFALVFMAGGMALFWAGAFAVARAAAGAGAWAAALLAPAMTLAELLRARAFTGFPWASPGHMLVDAQAGQAAAWGGVGLLTLGIMGLAALAAGPWAGRARRAMAMRAAVLLGGGVLCLVPVPEGAPVAGDRPVLRLVQPNAPQRLKWHPDHAPEFYQRQLRYTAAAPDAGAPRPDLVVWPETAVPVRLNDAGGVLARIAQAAGGAPVVLGLLRDEGPRVYNSAVVVGPGGTATEVYDKHHLVPFGEYVPFGDLLARWGIYGLAANAGQGFSAGPGAQLLDLGEGLGRALPLICYEAVFPRDVRAAPERPDFLLQITNDAWFGQVSGPWQHLAQARMRAIEQGLPMVRVANTGVSAMIDARGRVTAMIPLGQAGWRDAPLPAPAPPTGYAMLGDGPAAVLALLLLGLGGRAARRRSHNANSG
ncbi:apolipoprotein N-acyltransferase [Sediminimonas qiaohouensis]|uniref:apolipoprotein N-acyltransferase n=1 Tax=Sediminimonas qiaohouensis TaxID=552061 RepID=UPI00040B4A48|nr:apolipoprotein N-acyltransferase [Sediminimonas qiaohouensis]